MDLLNTELHDNTNATQNPSLQLKAIDVEKEELFHTRKWRFFFRYIGRTFLVAFCFASLLVVAHLVSLIGIEEPGEQTAAGVGGIILMIFVVYPIGSLGLLCFFASIIYAVRYGLNGKESWLPKTLIVIPAICLLLFYISIYTFGND